MRWIVLGLVLASSAAWAEPKPWMKQENPNSLGLWVSVGETCPFTKAEIEADVRGEFLRARITPTKAIDLSLDVDVSCMKVGETSSYALSAKINFSTGSLFLYHTPDYGQLGVAHEVGYIRNGIKEGISRAITDYLEANFGDQ